MTERDGPTPNRAARDLDARDPDPGDIGTRETAHDLNNLLTAIIAAADSALSRRGIDPETLADIEHIREGARRGSDLVAAGHPDAQDSGPDVAVNATIRGTSRLLAHRLGAGIALILCLDARDHRAHIAPSRLDRILLNLIGNARRALPDGGTVTLATERRTLAAPNPGVPDEIPAGDYVVIAVRDDGPGIPSDRVSRVFERGFSSWSDTKGTGLGLASVRDSVARSGGFLSVAGDGGRGACFEIWLPRHDEAATANTVLQTFSNTAPGIVLLVEDDVLVSEVATRILRREGWTVLHAENAETALAFLEDTACDLMIADVALPGIDGLELTQTVRARWPKLPVLLTSGYADRAGEIEPAPHVAFLTKPYGRPELLAVLSRVIEPTRVRAPRD